MISYNNVIKKGEKMKKQKNIRFCKIKSKLNSSVIIFDKLTEEAAAEIATNNQQFNNLIADAALIILRGDKKFIKQVEEW